MKYEIGQKVETKKGNGIIVAISGYEEDLYIVNITNIGEWGFNEHQLKPYRTAQERLFDLGFEKVAKHKYVKHHKGGSGYDTSYKITIEFAFNMYQVKCECENWLGVDLELSRILTQYLEELNKK